MMNYHKCFFIAIIMVLSTMTMGTCFSIADNNGTSSVLMRKEINLTIGGSGPQEEWNVTFGGDKYDIFFVATQTSDGGFIAVGGRDASSWDNGGDCFIVKTDENGCMQWNKTFGGSRTDNGHAIIQTSDGGYLISAITASYGAGSNDAWLIKTDASGNEQWNKTYGGRNYDLAEKSVIQTSDGNILLVGSTSSFGAGSLDGWLIKTDGYGNELWNKTYGTENEEHLWEVHETSDHGYIMIGYTAGEQHDAWVVKTDYDGNLEWEKKYGPANQGLSITQSTDGGYIFLAEVEHTVFSGYLNPWLVKIDKNGNREWDKLFITPQGKNKFAVHHNIKPLGDDYYILTGVTNAVTPVYSVGDMWISKIDGNGNILWEKIIGGTAYDTTYTVDPTADGGFIVSGMTKSFGVGDGFNAWLVKISDYNNQRPSKPATPVGKNNGKTGINYTYTSTCIEPDGESLFYIWEWGDKNYSYWFGPSNSGEPTEATYSWGQKGEYAVRVKTKDIFGGESDWSDPLPITMPYSFNKPLPLWLKSLFERFSNVFSLLKPLLGFSSMTISTCFSENDFAGAATLLKKKETNYNTCVLRNAVIPNDPFFLQQWALQNTGQTGGTPDADIDAPEAWDIETGNAEVVIAIIDSGIDLTHPDLVDNIWKNLDEIPDNGIDDDENGYVDDYQGYDFTFEDNDPYPLDHNGHGTVMSGVIAAMTNNEIGISGITWNCKIMPVKVVDANWTPKGNSIFDGIRYAADNGAKIICLAFGYPNSVTALKNAVDYAHNKGALLICSAGNFDNNRKYYPAAYDNVIAVAGTDHSDHRMEALYDFNGVWVNSSYGDWVDIAAPGEDIFTTSPTYHVTLCDTWGYDLNYDILSGTTLAAPVVAGVAGLVFSKNPDYSPDKIAATLKANSDPYDSPYYLGMGRVNAHKALMELNAEPEKPAVPEGASSGKVGDYYEYTVSTVDADGDQLYYLFDWGDGSTSDWLGPYDSNQLCTASNNWTEKGNYEIKVKAKDVFGLESDWSDPLPIKMPYSYTKPQLGFLSWLSERFPNAFPLLRQLLKY